MNRILASKTEKTGGTGVGLNYEIMKKIFLVFSVVLMLIVLLGSDIRRKKEAASAAAAEKKPCYGYTIIEFGKGLNCKGDTVSLTKIKGGGQILTRAGY